VDHREINRIAQAQHGLIARHQALDAGGTRRSIQSMVTSGRWDRARDGVYIVGAAQQTWHQRAMAAVLAAGSDAMTSHRTSVRLHEFVDRTGRLELLTDGYRRVRLPGVLVHRTIHLLPEDRTVIDGIPTTSISRTLIDVSPRQTDETIGRWLDRALQRGLVDLSALARRTTELTLPGRERPTSLMRALALRSPGHDPGRSVFEARVIEAAARRGLPPLTRQHQVVRPDGRRAFIDLAHAPSKVAIELDGWETHGIRSAFEPDRVRGNELLLLGWNLLRFAWLMSDDYICETIQAAIAGHLPPPHPTPISGRSCTSEVHR
jgi:very-short-patch-repair endonuclease